MIDIIVYTIAALTLILVFAYFILSLGHKAIDWYVLKRNLIVHFFEYQVHRKKFKRWLEANEGIKRR
ncbi:hypothetical protein AAU57_12030 [Nonlabens sp. YIK11]|nr:hypothetical protein AAU57_12030 [Nonlabens sp. YIK11]